MIKTMAIPSRSIGFLVAGCLLGVCLGTGLLWLLWTPAAPVAAPQPLTPPPTTPQSSGLYLTCPALAPASPGWLPVPTNREASTLEVEVQKSLDPRVEHWKVVWGKTPNRVYLICDQRLPWIVHAKADCRDLFAGGQTSSLLEQTCDKRIVIALQWAKKKIAYARRRPPRALLAQYKGRRDLLWSAGGRLRVVQGQRDSLTAAWNRVLNYLPEVENAFRSEGVPAMLARMVIVESLGHPAAGSVRGAKGAYQFISGTASNFLRVDAEVDERYDPVRAGWAAARYLQQLYSRFGRWDLALTAYNTGATRVRVLARHHRTEDLGVWADRGTRGQFGFDGQNYYAQIAAVIELTQNLPLPQRTRTPVAVEVRESTPLSVLALCLGVSLADLIAMNPALTGAILIQGAPVPAGYIMRLPDGTDLGRTAVGGAPPGSVAVQ